MRDVDRAIAEIQTIRAQLAASTRFRGIGPKATALTGLLSVTIALAQSLWPSLLATTPLRYISVWAAVTTLCFVIASCEAVARTLKLHAPIASVMLNAIVRQILPFAAAAIVVSVAVCRFSPDAVWLLPGIWQIFVALIGFSSLSYLPRGMVWPAVWYFISGSIVLTVAGSSGELSPWLMGIPLAVGQAVVATIMHFADSHSTGES